MLKGLEFSTESRDGQTRVYRLTGDLHGTREAYALQEQVRQAAAAGVKKVVLDLAGVGRIDSSGVGVLVAAMWSVSHAGGGLVLSALPPRIERVLGIAMLLDHIGHAASVEEALARLDAMDLGARG